MVRRRGRRHSGGIATRTGAHHVPRCHLPRPDDPKGSGAVAVRPCRCPEAAAIARDRRRPGGPTASRAAARRRRLGCRGLAGWPGPGSRDRVGGGRCGTPSAARGPHAAADDAGRGSARGHRPEGLARQREVRRRARLVGRPRASHPQRPAPGGARALLARTAGVPARWRALAGPGPLRRALRHRAPYPAGRGCLARGALHGVRAARRRWPLRHPCPRPARHVRGRCTDVAARDAGAGGGADPLRRPSGAAGGAGAVGGPRRRRLDAAPGRRAGDRWPQPAAAQAQAAA